MNDTLTINGIEYVRKDNVPIIAPDGEYCIVRCRNAGVHAGIVVSRKDGIIRLRDSRRLWRWWSAATLSELAIQGPVKVSENKYGLVLPLLDLTESDVCEVIPCSSEAQVKIRDVPVWVAAS